jgi:hypothetical protein
MTITLPELKPPRFDAKTLLIVALLAWTIGPQVRPHAADLLRWTLAKIDPPAVRVRTPMESAAYAKRQAEMAAYLAVADLLDAGTVKADDDSLKSALNEKLSGCSKPLWDQIGARGRTGDAMREAGKALGGD